MKHHPIRLHRMIPVLVVAILALLCGASSASAAPLDTRITSGPSGVTGDSTPTFTFDANGWPASFECAVDASSFSSCTSPRTTTELADGAHTFRVRYRFLFLFVDPTPATRSFTVDTTPPSVEITSPDEGETLPDGDLDVEFTAGDAVSATCEIDSDPPVACSSPWELSGLAEGDHSVTVTAVDAVGNSSSDEVEFSVAPAFTPGYEQVKTGYYTTCALYRFSAAAGDTNVRCWGYGTTVYGNGVTTYQSTPQTVLDGAGGSPLTGVKRIALGTGYACALMVDTTVRCWGTNTYGRVGVDSTASLIPYPTPVVSAPGSTTALSGVEEISVGGIEACVRMAGGTVKCWGYNGAGGLGDGTTTDRAAPVDVVTSDTDSSPLSGVVSIGADLHSCAVLVDTRVVCWGDNGLGQINSDFDTNPPTPVFINVDGSTSGTNLTGAASVHVHQWHTCVTTTDGRAQCWGLNGSGALGRGFGASSAPARLPDPQYVVTAPASSTHLTGIASLDPNGSCAVGADTIVRCWGANNSGQVGDGTTTSRDYAVPVVTSASDSNPLSGVAQADTGTSHACAVMADRTLRCWGNNDFGALGNGSTVGSLTPVVAG